MGVFLLFTVACGGPAEPGPAALDYATGWGGMFTGGLREDLGWEVADVFVTESGDCAAVALVSDGPPVELLLANTGVHSFDDVYASEGEERSAFVKGQVGGRIWVPTPDGPFVGTGGSVDAYRSGRLQFGTYCAMVISN